MPRKQQLAQRHGGERGSHRLEGGEDGFGAHADGRDSRGSCGVDGWLLIFARPPTELCRFTAELRTISYVNRRPGV